MKTLAALLKNPLTMAKFLNTGDLTKKALKERALAADALAKIEAALADVEADISLMGDEIDANAAMTSLMAAIKSATLIKAA
ncbi:hypothetical protein ACOI1H_13450 [Loktanella sp. DJP18]|uniref:hypothetical protein n=1 Tax=Loktanella sp. DJP18 TaxID=3409788 RepID=UPI003BB5E8DB